MKRKKKERIEEIILIDIFLIIEINIHDKNSSIEVIKTIFLLTLAYN
jgi:hypothetical protein